MPFLVDFDVEGRDFLLSVAETIRFSNLAESEGSAFWLLVLCCMNIALFN